MKCEFGLSLQLMFEISFQDHRLLNTVWLEYSPRKQKQNIASHFPNSVLQPDFANCNVQSCMSADYLNNSVQFSNSCLVTQPVQGWTELLILTLIA